MVDVDDVVVVDVVPWGPKSVRWRLDEEEVEEGEGWFQARGLLEVGGEEGRGDIE